MGETKQLKYNLQELSGDLRLTSNSNKKLRISPSSKAYSPRGRLQNLSASHHKTQAKINDKRARLYLKEQSQIKECPEITYRSRLMASKNFQQSGIKSISPASTNSPVSYSLRKLSPLIGNTSPIYQTTVKLSHENLNVKGSTIKRSSFFIQPEDNLSKTLYASKPSVNNTESIKKEDKFRENIEKSIVKPKRLYAKIKELNKKNKAPESDSKVYSIRLSPTCQKIAFPDGIDMKSFVHRSKRLISYSPNYSNNKDSK